MKTQGSRRLIGRGAAAVRIGLLGLAAHAAVSLFAAGESPQPAGPQTPLLMERQREIALALSACPQFVAAGASVYVLEKSGYVKVRDGRNGFTAIVGHILPDSQDPQCLDAEGTRTFLPRMLKVAEWRAQGKSPDEIKRLVAEAFARGVFQPPARPGVDYMLSSENLTPNEKGVPAAFPPHVMFYVPYLTNADLGSDGNQAGPAFVVSEGSPQALFIVPVAPHAGAGHAPGDKASGGTSPDSESPAVAAARAHVEAWSNHDFDKARRGLASDVQVRVTSTLPGMSNTNLSGVEDYMRGLKDFASLVVPGSLRVIGSFGDERNALLLVTVQATGGPFGQARMTLPAARLYRLDEKGKIQAEQVVFYAVPSATGA